MFVGAGSLAAVSLVILGSMLFGTPGSPGTSRTAFAQAPSGAYAIAVKADDTVDIIDAISLEDGAAYEIARVPHLPGYISHASVSPNGRHLALVVADGGTPGTPIASLQVIDIESGSMLRAGEAIDQLQVPLWMPDSSGVIVTITAPIDPETTAAADVDFWFAGLDGASRLLGKVPGVAGAYPVGFDPEGRFLAVRIDAAGSTLMRDFADVLLLSNTVTREWALSPEGTQLAYLEASLDGGLSYEGRIADISEPKGAIGAVTDDASGATGVAWAQSAAEPEFGTAPLAGDRADGFEVPLEFSEDDRFLALQQWSGPSIEDPGKMTIEVRGPSGTISLDEYARFYGWARR
jgi:hypothetical protein